MPVKTFSGLPTSEPPKCLILAENGVPTLAINYYCPDGRIYGFPYSYLVCWRYEKNPDASLQPNAPADRLSLWYSTHDVMLVGYRLAGLPALLQQNRIIAVHALDPKYFGLSNEAAFITDIIVKDQKEAQGEV